MFFDKIYGSWKGIQEKKYKEIFSILDKEFPNLLKEKIVLDIGSGRGYFESFLEKRGPKKIINLDIIPDKSLSLLGDGNHLPFQDVFFDIIISVDTMHLINNNDFLRVLKDDGYILFSNFFNDENYEERKNMLKDRLKDFKILKEFELDLKEKEFVILAKKFTSFPKE